MKKKIVLISSMGHSGTTIFDKIIGSCYKKSFSLGELINLPEVIRTNNYCTCQKRIKDCVFWNNINKSFGKNGFNFFSNTSVLNNMEWSFSDIKSVIKIKINKKEKRKFLIHIILLKNLYYRIFTQSNSKVLVDSSKNLIRNLLIYKILNKYFDIKVIHLIRDPRGVVVSYKKTHYTVKYTDNGPLIRGERNIYKSTPKNLVSIIFKWIIKNVIITISGWFFIKRKDFKKVVFDDFTENASSMLFEIGNWLEINEIDYEQLNSIGNKELHMVTGNASRFYKGPLLRMKGSWLGKLQGIDLLFTIICTYLFMKIYGFK